VPPPGTNLISVMAASPNTGTSLRSIRRVHRFGKRAEPRQDRLGERLGVASRYGAKQHKLDHFVIGEGVGARIAKALPKPRDVRIMWLARILEAHAAGLIDSGGAGGPSLAGRR